jgi:hypothetical protein
VESKKILYGDDARRSLFKGMEILAEHGIDIEEPVSLIISRFCQTIFNKLTMEFAGEVYILKKMEADRLLSLKLEGAIIKKNIPM